MGQDGSIETDTWEARGGGHYEKTKHQMGFAETRGPDFQEGSRGILLESSLQTDLYFPACGQLEKLRVAFIFIISIAILRNP